MAVAAGVGPLVVLAATAAGAVGRSARDAAADRLAVAALSTAGLLREPAAVITQAAARDAATGPSPASSLAQAGADAVWWLGPDGAVDGVAGDAPPTPPPLPAEPDGPFIITGDGTVAVVAARPGGGTVVGAFDSEAVLSFLTPRGVSGDVVVGLAAGGRVVGPGVLADVADRLTPSPDGEVRTIPTPAGRHMVAVVPVDDTGLSVVAAQPTSAIDDEVAPVARTIWVVTGVLAAWVVAATALVLRAQRARSRSERRAAAEAAAARRIGDQLAAAAEAGRVGLWTCDPATGTVTLSQLAAELLGLEDTPGPAGPTMHLHELQERVGPPAAPLRALETVTAGAAAPLQVTLEGVGAADRVLDVVGRPGDDGVIRGTVVDATARHRVAVALEQARQRAEELAELRSRLVADASHEIRTPVHAITGLVDVLASEPLTPSQRAVVEDIRTAARTLADLVSDILDVSRLSTGSHRDHREPFDPGELAAQAARVVALRHPGLADRIRLEPPQRPVTVVGDAPRIRQVITNLVDNAAKFAPDGPVEIDVSVTGDGGGPAHLRVAVTDHGPGIEPGERDRIFEPFHRGRPKPSGEPAGAGLGLAICRELVTRLGGEIGVDSEPGAATTFWFTVPVAPAPPAGQPAPGPVEPLRVLVVEDNPIGQRVAARQLAGRGHVVDVVGDADAALSALAGGSYDVVLMDCELPGTDGPAATVAIRRMDGPARDVPVIALTAWATPEDRRRCLDAGMDDFVAKPVDWDQLHERMVALASRGRAPGPSVPGSGPVGVGRPPTGEDALDGRIVADLRRLETASPGTLVELAGAFATHVADLLGRLRDSRDPAEVRAICHDLVGAAGAVGADRVVAVARELGALARAGTTPDAGRIGELEAVAAAAVAALEALAAEAMTGVGP